MGFTPAQTRALSLWEYHCALAGVSRANSPPGPSKTAPPTSTDFRAKLREIYGDEGPE